MKQNKTRVMFKDFKGDVIALFPDEVADPHGNIMSYMHIGQHGAASPALKHLRNAKDYSALKRELVSIGYELEVSNETK